MALNVKWIEKEMTYTGAELRPHFLLTKWELKGSALSGFLGPCEVRTDHLVDWEDRVEGEFIQARRMLHFIGEFFGMSLVQGVYFQRLFIASVAEMLQRQLREQNSDLWIRREGNDLRVEERKLSVSIVTASPVSVLFHFALNVDAQGAPVAAIGLDEMNLGCSASELGRKFLEHARVEWDEIEWSCAKVRPVL